MKAIFVLAAALLLPAAAAVPPTTLRIAAATSAAARLAASPRASWDWPLSPRPAVLRAFDPPDKPWLSGHRGVDLQATHDGGEIASPESGTVSFTGVVVDRPVITIDHGGGLRSSFEPVESALKAGDVVVKGGPIGTLRQGHCGAVPCVHWGVRRGDVYVNPLEFVMDLRPSILLPMADGPLATLDQSGKLDGPMADGPPAEPGQPGTMGGPPVTPGRPVALDDG